MGRAYSDKTRFLRLAVTASPAAGARWDTFLAMSTVAPAIGLLVGFAVQTVPHGDCVLRCGSLPPWRPEAPDGGDAPAGAPERM